jgi:hypothetical protein
MAYQPWNSIFLSQQISHSQLISQKNSLPNRAMVAQKSKLEMKKRSKNTGVFRRWLSMLKSN